MANHKLKIKDHYYQSKLNGDKPFEIRKNDRDFQRGDTVRYTNINGVYLDDRLYMITYVTNFEQKPGYVVFGDKDITDA